jgi:hypothetical protein
VIAVLAMFAVTFGPLADGFGYEGFNTFVAAVSRATAELAGRRNMTKLVVDLFESGGVVSFCTAVLVARARAVVRLARGAAVVESSGATRRGAQAAVRRHQAAGRLAVRRADGDQEQ